MTMTWKDVLDYARNGNPKPDKRVEKTEDEWRELLTTEEFNITRKKGTERAFTGEYCEAHEPGLYACRCCGTPLFDSRQKFDSGTGWPSFTIPVRDNVINNILDNSHGMSRVEVTCSVCDCHLGHVFPDGPPPSGLRYCINSASVRLVEDE
jgi:methionine-R-sulfoxide reductase